MVDGGAVERRKGRTHLILASAARKSRATRTVFNEKFSTKNCISNRNWPKNRSRRKQTTKALLTGTRIDIRYFEFLAHSVAQQGGFSKWSRPLLTGTAPQTEFDVNCRKQTTEKFLTGARTHISNFTFSKNFVTQIAPKFATRRSHRKVGSLGEKAEGRCRAEGPGATFNAKQTQTAGKMPALRRAKTTAGPSDSARDDSVKRETQKT
jgi:hypothetical protein